MKKIKQGLQKDISRPIFWVLVGFVVVLKVVLSRFQMFYTWIDGAPIDDELMFAAARSISAGQWLGDYTWLTLSKHMFFSVWLAGVNWLRIPYLAAGQLLNCAAALCCAFAFAPVLRRRKSQFLVFLLLCFNPAASAAFTLRVYRDNIFPALCMLFFAGLCGYALRCRSPYKKGLPWLILCGVGLAAAYLAREDGIWLLPFAAVGCLVLFITALRDKGAFAQKLGRCAVLAVPFALLLGGIWGYSALNYAHYGVFTVSDFSSGGFAQAMGAMNRVKEKEWTPLVSVPADVRAALYDAVPSLAPLQPWLEENEELRNSYVNPKLNDYQAGSFYWALRKAAFYEGVYDTAPGAESYWQQVADEINALCDSGALPAKGGRRSGTTPPIRAEYVLPVLKEGIKSIGHTLAFFDCAPYDAQNMTIGLPEDLTVWENYLGERCNVAAQAGTALPYYSPLQKLAYAGLEVIRWVYALALPLLTLAAVCLQTRQGVALLRQRKKAAIAKGDALLWTLLLGLFAMALLRCFMIAFMEVASFNIGTYSMYLSTVHPLFILFASVGVLSCWRKNH